MIKRTGRFDWFLFLPMLLLLAIGVVAIYSAGAARGGAFAQMWKETLATGLVGLFLYGVLAYFDYREMLFLGAIPAYAFALVALLAVLLFGSTVYGGRRWLWFFQPSEISKLCIIVFLAQIYGTLRERFRGQFRFKGFLLAGAIVGVPALLILMEPDLGTAITLAPAAYGMLLAAGVWRRGLLIALVSGILAVSVIIGAVYEAEKPGVEPARREAILKVLPLRPHQVKRIKTFVFPESDPRSAGYNLMQAKISIGSSGFLGKGIGRGENNRLKYLPPSVSMNDFIFCVWAEETGFLGTLILLSLFSLLCFAGLRIAFLATDPQGHLLAIGLSLLIFAHVYVNIGMTIGLVPITGLPLPFISSGRTFLVTIMCGLGLLQSVSLHREVDA